MRLGGLSSGLDTDTMVKEMMKPYQAKVDKVKQDKTIVEMKQELYRDVIKDMKSIYTKYFDITSSANKGSNLIMGSNYETIKFTSSDDSVVTAKGLAGAKGGNYTVAVDQIATASKLDIKMDAFKNATEDKVKLSIGGEEIEISLLDKDNKSIKDNSRAIIDNINTAIAEHNKKDGAKKIDVKISYSEMGDKISIESKTTGKDNNLEMKVTSGIPSEITDSNNNIIKVIEAVDAKDAIVNLTDSNGNKLVKTSASNNFTIDNVQYTIHGVSEKKEDGSLKETKLKGTVDSSNTIENIRGFVNDYNNLIDKVNKLTTEKSSSSYRPLTEEQKKEMSEDEIKLWNSKVKQGLLRNDDILAGTVNELLNVFSTKLGNGLNLSSIGITTNSDYRTQKGKLVLDEEKLSEALSEKGEETRKLLTDTFSKVKDVFNETAISSTSKLAKRAGTEGSVTAVNNELTKKMEDQQKRIDKMLKDLKRKEDAFYKQFTRLEVAMNKTNSQMSYFMQQG